MLVGSQFLRPHLGHHPRHVFPDLLRLLFVNRLHGDQPSSWTDPHEEQQSSVLSGHGRPGPVHSQDPIVHPGGLGGKNPSPLAGRLHIPVDAALAAPAAQQGQL